MAKLCVGMAAAPDAYLMVSMLLSHNKPTLQLDLCLSPLRDGRSHTYLVWAYLICIGVCVWGRGECVLVCDRCSVASPF